MVNCIDSSQQSWLSLDNFIDKTTGFQAPVNAIDHAFLSSMKESIALTEISIFIISDRLNDYRSVAWPNDLLYIFPVVIFGTIAAVVGLGVLEPTQLGEPANPFATPIEILPEWYFFSTFNLLRTIPNKLLGVLSMAAVPVGLLTVPFIENVNKFQNPFRRPVATTVFLFGTVAAIWLGIGAALPIDKALTLGLF